MFKIAAGNLAWVVVGFAITFSALNAVLTYNHYQLEEDMPVCPPY